MEGRLTAYDAAFEAQGDDDDDTRTLRQCYILKIIVMTLLV